MVVDSDPSEELRGFVVGGQAIVVKGEYEGAVGCIASFESGRVLLDIPEGMVFHESSPIIVHQWDLVPVPQRAGQPGGARPGRRRGPPGRK